MKRLILLGGGHAHVFVLDSLARTPIRDLEVLLVSPFERQLYSGMLPGWIAGHYPLEACALSLAALAGRAGARLVPTAAVALDADAGRIRCLDGSELDYDWLSIDTGSRSAVESIEGAADHALALRPIEGFIHGLEELLRLCRDRQGPPVAIIGGGVAAVELAFAIHHRVVRDGYPSPVLRVIADAGLPLEGLTPGVQSKCLDLMAQRRIDWHAGSHVARLTGTHAVLRDGSRIPAGRVLLAIGAGAPLWPAESGLATDMAGFIEVRSSLQSRSHPNVFASGDVASLPDRRPKSGVYAVRAGPPLAANLRRAVAGEPLRDWRPQRRALSLVSTGDRYALGAWGPFGCYGRWVWRWKDHIDRKFMRRFGNPHVG